MPRVVSELTIPMFERAKTVHALNFAATVIVNMYTDIPKLDVINIITNALKLAQKSMKLPRKKSYKFHTVMERNYFQSDQELYKQTEGLSMPAQRQQYWQRSISNI
jgi:hypothetical protein